MSGECQGSQQEPASGHLRVARNDGQPTWTGLGQAPEERHWWPGGPTEQRGRGLWGPAAVSPAPACHASRSARASGRARTTAASTAWAPAATAYVLVRMVTGYRAPSKAVIHESAEDMMMQLESCLHPFRTHLRSQSWSSPNVEVGA